MNGNTRSNPGPNSRSERLIYGAFFGLDEDPFRVTPDARFFFAGDRLKSASAELMAHVQAPRGVSLLTGGAGSGKSLVLRWLATELSGTHPVTMLWHASLNLDELVAEVCTRVGVESSASDVTSLLAALHNKLLSMPAGKGTPVLLVDEANSLCQEVLKALPILIGSFDHRPPLMSVVLAVESSRRNQFLQSIERLTIGHEMQLEALHSEDVAQYIRHRVSLAGGDGDYLFTNEALATIADISGGLPRLINTLCGKALLLAYLGEEHHVTVQLVNEVARELWTGASSSAALFDVDSQSQSEFKAHESGERVGEERPTRFTGQVSAPTPKSPADDGQPSDPLNAAASAHPQRHGNQIGSHARTARPPVIGRRMYYRPGFLGLIGLLLLVMAVTVGTDSGRRLLEAGLNPLLDEVRNRSGTVVKRQNWGDLPADEEQGVGPGADLEVRIEQPEDGKSPPAASIVAERFQTGEQPNSTLGYDGRYRIGERDRVVSTQTPARVPKSELFVKSPGPLASTGDDGSARGLEALRERRIHALMIEAVRHLNERRFVEPVGRNALESYRHVLRLNPAHAGAKEGLQKMYDNFLRWGKVAENRDDWSVAYDYYQNALKVGPATAELETAVARVQRKSR